MCWNNPPPLPGGKLLQEHREFDQQGVAGRVPSVREHAVPELHGGADVVGTPLIRCPAPDVVPDPGHDVLGPDVRLVEHAEPEPVRERPPQPGVVLSGHRCGGHANGAGHRVRVDGQHDSVAAGRHVKRRTPGAAVRERQPPERVHAPVVDERGRRCRVPRRSSATVRPGEHGTVVRADLPESAGVPGRR